MLIRMLPYFDLCFMKSKNQNYDIMKHIILPYSMSKNIKTSKEVVRVSGKLKEVITVQDEHGNILQKMISPLMVEFYPRDVFQVIVGASLLAVPLAYTEETWKLGETLPMINIVGLLGISMFFISAFVYYNFYRTHFLEHWIEFIKRVISIYVLSFLVVAVLLTLIERAPWDADMWLAIKRVIIVAFPASLSAAVADVVK